MSDQKLFERIGGRDAIEAAVEIFYKKVLKDDRIKHFFDSTDMKDMLSKQKKFLAYAFGGPVKYDGKNMRDAHAHLVQRGMTDLHFDAVAENLVETLQELEVPEGMVQEVVDIAESVRGDVLGK